MGLKLISRNERYPIETEYTTGYDIKIETPRTLLAKMPETKNEIIVTLEVPKSEYKNDINVQTIMKWAEMSVNEQDYFRDIAVHFTTDEGINERSIVFTHAKITLEEFGNVKSDFVEITITINQRRDKFTGVMFGINLDDTYERAWYRANNPPTVNIVVPPDVKDDGIDYVQSFMKDEAYIPKKLGNTEDLSSLDMMQGGIYYKYGKIINAMDKVEFSPVYGKGIFIYSDGPEEIRHSQNDNPFDTQALITNYSRDYRKNTKGEGDVYLIRNFDYDIEFYHKNGVLQDIRFGLIIKNYGKETAHINIYKCGYINSLNRYKCVDGIAAMKAVSGNNDEILKEEMCAEIQLGFLSSLNSNPETLEIKPGEIKFISSMILEAKNESYQPRIYGRFRINCDADMIKLRIISSKKTGVSKEELDTIWKTAWYNEKSSNSQFCGIVNYREINLNIIDMQPNESIILGTYKRGQTDEHGIWSYGEYPKPLDIKPDSREYFFGNYGVIYNINLTWSEGAKTNEILFYPFGHNVGYYADFLIKEQNKSWKRTGSLRRKEELMKKNEVIKNIATITNQNDQIEKNRKKIDDNYYESINEKNPNKYDTSSYTRYWNHITGDETNYPITIPKNTKTYNFKFMMSGGNCGGIKFKLADLNKKNN